MLTSRIHFDDVHHDDIVYPGAIGFTFVHLATLGALWSGVTPTAVALCLGLYFLRMFAITAGFHRYFSHRSFQTSRFSQFLLAFLAQTSLQQGVLWWSAKHRHHHKYSDMPEDVHSPRHHGFLFAHLGWIFARRRGQADYDLVKDLSQYPELRWLDKHKHLPGVLLGVVCFLVAGWPGLFIGFFLSTVLVYHGAFAINSLAHVFGRQRYLTGDDSRNNWFLALITMGEGWHNNHHYYQVATRQGWRWWEIDVTYYILKLLSWLRLVWDLKGPPSDVLEGERRLPRRAIEQVAHELAATFPIERIAEQVRATWSQRPGLEEIAATAPKAKARLESLLKDVSVPHPQLPSVDDIRRRARSMAPCTPSLEEVAERTREVLIEAVSAHLIAELQPARA